MSAHIRLVLIFCVGLGAAFALGARATRNVRFPYVSNDLNAPCGKTVFEWNILAARLDAEPIPLVGREDFELVRLIGDPQPQGLIIRAYVRAKDPSKVPVPNTPAWNNMVNVLRSQTPGTTISRFQLGPNPRNCFLLTHLDDCLLEIQGNGKSIIIPPEATSAEQSAALAKIMSQEPAP